MTTIVAWAQSYSASIFVVLFEGGHVRAYVWNFSFTFQEAEVVQKVNAELLRKN